MDWDKLLSKRRRRESNRLETETRLEFERDYDRAVFCTPVRRLQDKAQVFPLEALDAIRTRLTHSIEVSTIARDLADITARWLVDSKRLKSQDQVAAIRSIAATCGLIHDLGNPPFGHAGEHAIREWFCTHAPLLSEFRVCPSEDKYNQFGADFRNFEGNAQTLRLVAKLQVLADPFGLNLTYGTLSAVRKYIARSNSLTPADRETKKVGYFASENKLVAEVEEETGTQGCRNPLTYLVEASDDIAYLPVDLEDGVKKRVLDWATLKQELRTSGNGCKLVEESIQAAEKQIDGGTAKLTGQDADEAYSVALRIAVIARLVPAAIASFKENYEAIMAGDFHSDLLSDSRGAELAAACRNVAKKYVYHASETLRLELMGRQVIQDLMDSFWEGVENWQPDRPQDGFPNSVYSLLSPNYRIVFENSVKERSLPSNYCKLQLVTDYISGMTDTFACTLHRRLKNA